MAQDAIFASIAGTDTALALTDAEGNVMRLTAVDGTLKFASKGVDALVLANNTTSARALVNDTANHKFVSRYYDNGATSGDATGDYLRLYISGAGGGGDALRSFATVSDVAAATVRGAHISLSMGTSGTVTGLGAAIEATLHIPSTAGQTGTLYALKAAINSDAATSDPAGATTLAYFAAVNQGDATGGADVDDDAALIHIDGHTIGNGNLVEAVGTAYALAELTHSIRIKIGSTAYYIPISNLAASAT
jgi:hypothetical protein